MKLFWAPQTRAIRAIWMLEEAGVDYDLELVDIRNVDRQDSEEFLAASPMGKVPALVDGKAGTAAICLYVADRYRPGQLAPGIDASQRGEFLYWLMFTPAVVEPAMTEKFNKVEAARARNGWGDFDTMISTFDHALRDKKWILGAEFTAADVMLGSSAIFLRQFNMLPDTQNIEAYADRCTAREAYQRALAAAGE
jgi:glutathione S-transferase